MFVRGDPAGDNQRMSAPVRFGKHLDRVAATIYEARGNRVLERGGNVRDVLLRWVAKRRDLLPDRRLGTTIDDAVGEAFDKTAKLLGMG
jgi:hypothetical protein